MLTLKTLSARYPHTEAVHDGRITSPILRLDFQGPPLVHNGFKPFIRDLAFDCGELAIVTFLQAKAAGQPLVLIPLVLSSRFHHGSLYYNRDFGEIAPRDLEGRSVAIRSYTQTTVTWVRGILAHDYGVDLHRVTWVTFEDSHLAGFVDPPGSIRAAPSQTPESLLAAGEVAAAIPITLASETLKAPPFAPLIPDADAAALDWHRRTGISPNNHMLVVQQWVVDRHPEAVRELVRLYRAAADLVPATPPRRYGVEANRLSLEAIALYAAEQGVIPKPLSVEQIYAGLPPDLWG